MIIRKKTEWNVAQGIDEIAISFVLVLIPCRDRWDAAMMM